MIETEQRRTVRIAAVSDTHCTRQSQGVLAPLLHQAGAAADVVVMCGDLTDYGLPEEAQVLAREIQGVRAQIVAVLGNHDFESGHQEEIKAILTTAGVTVLDGESIEVHGVGIAGIKGFAGGFGRHTLGPWGEPAMKSFVREAIDEALKLESALARLRTPQRLALMHYSPVKGTVEGEPPEIYAFLGSSRLEEPLMRYPVSAVIHGHAHKGCPEGQMSNGVPVYNVALPLLRKLHPEGPHYRLIELPAEV